MIMLAGRDSKTFHCGKKDNEMAFFSSPRVPFSTFHETYSPSGHNDNKHLVILHH